MKIPETIGKYKINCLLAEGGQGAVFKAVHPELKRFVIIKKMSLRGKVMSGRFRREAGILMDMNNIHIVHLYDYFAENGAQYIVMEFVDGMPLSALLKKMKTFPPQMAAVIVLDIALALKYAHEKGIVHRDVKPANILISKRGEVKLADFGIAAEDSGSAPAAQAGKAEPAKRAGGRGSRSSAAGDLTVTGSAIGTPAYMPPEQFEDAGSVDGRADIYSLGVVFYEMLAGVKPPPGANGLSVAKKVSGIPAGIRRLIRKMTRRKKERRFRTLDPVIAKLRAYLKPYPQRGIRIAMIKNMAGISASGTQFAPVRSGVRRVCSAVLAALCLSGVLAAAVHTGFFYRTLLRPFYTPADLSVRVPSRFLPAGGARFHVSYFTDDGGSIPEVESAAGILKARKDVSGNPAGTDDSGVLFSGRTVFLRPGEYRVKLTFGPRVWWRSFSVGQERAVLQIPFPAVPEKPLRVSVSVRDAVTRREIPGASVSVLDGGRAVPLSEYQDGLTAGKIWRFRCGAGGYTGKEFSLRLEWYQDELFLEADLVPES